MSGEPRRSATPRAPPRGRGGGGRGAVLRRAGAVGPLLGRSPAAHAGRAAGPLRRHRLVVRRARADLLRATDRARAAGGPGPLGAARRRRAGVAGSSRGGRPAASQGVVPARGPRVVVAPAAPPDAGEPVWRHLLGTVAPLCAPDPAA